MGAADPGLVLNLFEVCYKTRPRGANSHIAYEFDNASITVYFQYCIGRSFFIVERLYKFNNVINLDVHTLLKRPCLRKLLVLP